MNRKSRPGVFITAALTFALIITSFLASRPLAQDAPSAAGSSILDGVFTADQASRGQKQFELACVACHSVSEHASPEFGEKWQGTTVGDLFDLMSYTMPQTDPGSLKPEEYASIIAFFLSEVGYKQGEKELPSDRDALGKIRIELLPKPPSK